MKQIAALTWTIIFVSPCSSQIEVILKTSLINQGAKLRMQNWIVDRIGGGETIQILRKNVIRQTSQSKIYQQNFFYFQAWLIFLASRILPFRTSLRSNHWSLERRRKKIIHRRKILWFDLLSGKKTSPQSYFMKRRCSKVIIKNI